MSSDGGLATALVDVVEEATGRSHRENPTAPATGGPAGNARLTAWMGLVLLTLSLVELVTLLDVSGLISWHIFVGTLLVPPALVKTTSTGWRIIRYYAGSRGYRAAGPPPLLLRLLGPLVVLSTLGLLGSGLALIALGPGDSRTNVFSVPGRQIDVIMIHKVVFLLWIAVTGLHVLGRFVPALKLTVLPADAARRTAGRRTRTAVLTGSLASAVVLAFAILAASGHWVAGGALPHR